MKLYEQELRMILDECVAWGKDERVSGLVDSSVASNGKVIKMKSNSVSNLPKQRIIDCVGYVANNSMYAILKSSKELSFVAYMRDVIISRCNKSRRLYNSSNYSFVIDDFRVNDYMEKFGLTKCTAYNYICKCEKLEYIYDEGNCRYSLSFIFNPFKNIEDVIKQNESFAIQYYSSTPEGELFINKKYGSFDKSPWSKHVMIGSEVYTLSEKSSSIPTAILRWLDGKMKENNRDSYYIDYNDIALKYSIARSRISNTKVRRFVNIMENDGVLFRSGDMDKKRICYGINYSVLKK